MTFGANSYFFADTSISFTGASAGAGLPILVTAAGFADSWFSATEEEWASRRKRPTITMRFIEPPEAIPTSTLNFFDCRETVSTGDTTVLLVESPLGERLLHSLR